jgi:hypothetical protein
MIDDPFSRITTLTYRIGPKGVEFIEEPTTSGAPSPAEGITQPRRGCRSNEKRRIVASGSLGSTEGSTPRGPRSKRGQVHYC